MPQRYFITSDGDAPLDIASAPDAPDHFDVTYQGQTLRVSARLAASTLHLLIDGHSHTCDVRPVDGGARVTLQGLTSDVGILDERRFLRRARATPDADTGAEVRSPMAGRVVKLLAAPGQAVSPGQGLIIVEAMKMENEIKATRLATVATYAVEPGQSVDPGQLLVTLS
jgi:acetyl/propionyl-CoA carboxylase alpha subunit